MDFTATFDTILWQWVVPIFLAGMAAFVSAAQAAFSKKAGLDSEAVARDGFHKALRSHVEALIIEAVTQRIIPATGDVTMEMLQKVLAPLDALMRETNPEGMAKFSSELQATTPAGQRFMGGIGFSLIFQLALQYVPEILARVRAMRQAAVPLADASVIPGAGAQGGTQGQVGQTPLARSPWIVGVLGLAILAMVACTPRQVTQVSETTRVPEDLVLVCRDYVAASLAPRPGDTDYLNSLRDRLVEAGKACLKTVAPAETTISAYGIARQPEVVTTKLVDVTPDLAGEILTDLPAD